MTFSKVGTGIGDQGVTLQSLSAKGEALVENSKTSKDKNEKEFDAMVAELLKKVLKKEEKPEKAESGAKDISERVVAKAGNNASPKSKEAGDDDSCSDWARALASHEAYVASDAAFYDALDNI